jgi:hypothetical protein
VSRLSPDKYFVEEETYLQPVCKNIGLAKKNALKNEKAFILLQEAAKSQK